MVDGWGWQKHTWMNVGFLNVLSDLALVTVVLSETLVSVTDHLVKVKLVVVGVAGHEIRLAQRELVTLVRLPQMEDFAIQMDHLLHLSVLGNLPDGLGYTGWTWHEKHAGFNFEDVRMPKLALFLVECLIESRCDHVFDTNKASIWFRRVVENALADL